MRVCCQAWPLRHDTLLLPPAHLPLAPRPPARRPSIADVQVDKARQLAAELGEGNAIAQECDVSQEADIESLIQTAVDKFGGVDIMCNNAGACSWRCCLLDWLAVLPATRLAALPA